MRLQPLSIYLLAFTTQSIAATAEKPKLHQLKDSTTKIEEETLKLPRYFAGKDETCLDDQHHPKKTKVLKLKLSSLMQLTTFFSPTDSEAYCIVENTSPKVAPKSFTISGSRCQVLREKLGQDVELGTVGNHICSVK